MQANTEKKRKKVAPVVCALIAMAFFAVYLAIFIYPILCESMEELAVKLILAVYAAITAAAIIGVGAALVQRLREIDGGEEEAAKKY